MSSGTPDRPSTPDAAIAALMEGNARYVAGEPAAHNPPSAREGLAAGQAPFAAVIRCADSRVAPEIVFDQALGELFVCAVAGNVPTPEIIASIEYGVSVLGCRTIVVMGHSCCGAVQAAIEHRGDPSALPGSLPMLIDQIALPCTWDDSEALAEAVEHNANHGVALLMQRSSLVADAVGAGRLKIIAGVQDLATGRFEITG